MTACVRVCVDGDHVVSDWEVERAAKPMERQSDSGMVPCVPSRGLGTL